MEGEREREREREREGERRGEGRKNERTVDFKFISWITITSYRYTLWLLKLYRLPFWLLNFTIFFFISFCLISNSPSLQVSVIPRKCTTIQLFKRLFSVVWNATRMNYQEPLNLSGWLQSICMKSTTAFSMERRRIWAEFFVKLMTRPSKLMTC